MAIKVKAIERNVSFEKGQRVTSTDDSLIDDDDNDNPSTGSGQAPDGGGGSTTGEDPNENSSI